MVRKQDKPYGVHDQVTQVAFTPQQWATNTVGKVAMDLALHGIKPTFPKHISSDVRVAAEKRIKAQVSPNRSVATNTFVVPNGHLCLFSCY